MTEKLYFPLMFLINNPSVITEWFIGFKIRELKYEGIQIFTDNSPLSLTYLGAAGALDSLGFADCNAGSVSCNLSQPYNSWNPFVDYFNYSVVSGAPRGDAQTTVSPTFDPLIPFKFTVDINNINTVTGSPTLIPDLFGVEFDTTKNFYLKYEVRYENPDVLVMGQPTTFNYVVEVVFDRLKQQIDLVFNTTINQLPEFSFIDNNLGWYEGDGTNWRYDDLAGSGDCGANRTRGIGICVLLPKPPEPDRGFKECCYTNIVLVDTETDDPEKNDYKGWFYQLQTEIDTVDFKIVRLSDLQEFDLNDSTYGEFFPAGTFDNGLFTGYKVDWKKVSQTLGYGSYQLKTEGSTPSPFTVESNTFTVLEFNNVTSKNYVRIESVQNGILEDIGVDFKDSNWCDMVRIPGYFGNRTSTYEVDDLIFQNGNRTNIKKDRVDTWAFETGFLPVCITDEIINYHFMANEIFMTDYNLNNHSYELIRKPVQLDEFNDPEYPVLSRKARLSATFKDRIENHTNNSC